MKLFRIKTKISFIFSVFAVLVMTPASSSSEQEFSQQTKEFTKEFTDHYKTHSKYDISLMKVHSDFNNAFEAQNANIEEKSMEADTPTEPKSTSTDQSQTTPFTAKQAEEVNRLLEQTKQILEDAKRNRIEREKREIEQNKKFQDIKKQMEANEKLYQEYLKNPGYYKLTGPSLSQEWSNYWSSKKEIKILSINDSSESSEEGCVTFLRFTQENTKNNK